MGLSHSQDLLTKCLKSGSKGGTKMRVLHCWTLENEEKNVTSRGWRTRGSVYLKLLWTENGRAEITKPL